MTDYYALTNVPLAKTMRSNDPDFAIRTLSEHERLSIEDYFFKNGKSVPVLPDSTAVVIPQTFLLGANLEEFSVLTEFSLALLTISGFQPISLVASFKEAKCIEAIVRPIIVNAPPKFPKKITKDATGSWLRRFFEARKKIKDKMHIPADRFVRYSRTTGSDDSLVDLCICLESLLDSQTEISFRFGTCLAKITKGDKLSPVEVGRILSDLYDYRSRVVHGSDSSKARKKIQPHLADLRRIARSILTDYVLFLSDHTKEEWKGHLHSSLYV